MLLESLLRGLAPADIGRNVIGPGIGVVVGRAALRDRMLGFELAGGGGRLRRRMPRRRASEIGIVGPWQRGRRRLRGRLDRELLGRAAL
jgi:hypothetical protein